MGAVHGAMAAGAVAARNAGPIPEYRTPEIKSLRNLGDRWRTIQRKIRWTRAIALVPLVPALVILGRHHLAQHKVDQDVAQFRQELDSCQPSSPCEPGDLSAELRSHVQGFQLTALNHPVRRGYDEAGLSYMKDGIISNAVYARQNPLDQEAAELKAALLMMASALTLLAGMGYRDERAMDRDALREADELCEELEDWLGVSREEFIQCGWSDKVLNSRMYLIQKLNIPGSQLQNFDAIILLADISKALRKTEGEIGNRPSTFSDQRKNAIAAAMNIVDKRSSVIGSTIESYRRGNVGAVAPEEAALVAFASLCAEQVGDKQLKEKVLPVEESMDLLMQVSRETRSDLIVQVDHARTSRLLEPIRTGNIPEPVRLGPLPAHEGATRELSTTLGALYL